MSAHVPDQEAMQLASHLMANFITLYNWYKIAPQRVSKSMAHLSTIEAEAFLASSDRLIEAIRNGTIHDQMTTPDDTTRK